MDTRRRIPAILDPARFGLGLVLAVAALLRFWALSHGAPFSVQIDEPEVLLRAVRMMKTGDFHPHFFDYPTLYIYLQAMVATLRFLAGAMQGQWAALDAAPPEAFYVWGRAATASLGTATIWLVYRAGLRWGRSTALLAAAMFAVMPLHVRESHYVLTDVPMTFFVMLTLLLSLRARERATAAAFAWAGVAAGLAAGTKYNGVLAVMIPLLACLMTPETRPSRAAVLLGIVASMLAAFLVVAPYTILDLPTFLNQFARLSGEYRTPKTLFDPVWMIYLKHLRNALQWPGSVVVIAGLLLGGFRILFGPNRAAWVLLTIFPIAYFRFISGQMIFFGRYLLPLLPFLSILGAAAVVSLIEAVRGTRMPRVLQGAMAIALLVITVGPPAYTSIAFDATAAKVWTTELAYNWILERIPPGSSVTMESRQVLLPLTYKVAYETPLQGRPLEYYAQNGVQYLVASSAIYGPFLDDSTGGPKRYPDQYAYYMNLFGSQPELARFSPSREHPGPEVRIFSVAPDTER